MRTLLVLSAVASLAALLFGCVAGPENSRTPVPAFAAASFRTLALAPVAFADEPLDRRVGIETADGIRDEARQTLLARGYDVEVMAAPSDIQVAQVPPGSALAELAPPLPAGTDGVILIRVDHFFDVGLYERRDRIPVELHATAALLAPDGRVIWRAEGTGEALQAPSGFQRADLHLMAGRLVDSLFRTFPSR